MRPFRLVDEHIKNQLNTYIAEVGKQLGGVDTMSIFGPILPPGPILPGGPIIPGVDQRIRNVIEMKKDKTETLAIVLHTNGGVVEVVERMVQIIRKFYKKVIVIVPNVAMSAGTVFTLSADEIMMDYFSCLGPIDPQIWKDDKLIPALSYIKQYEKLNEKASEDKLTILEYAMSKQLDLGELYQFEQARELSKELLIKWLSKYKFKDWKKTETRQLDVTDEMKEKRAEEIADILNNPERWHSHSRGIDILTLRDELNLKINDYSENSPLGDSIKRYFNLLYDYVIGENIFSFIHTEEYF